MYNGKKILAFVPARKGSKRVTLKNVQELDGKPLFMHSVEVAQKSKYIDSILVSTDSREIKTSSVDVGCIDGDLRPDDLSGDRARIVDAIIYEIESNNIDIDVVVLLQPTYPFRTVEMLDTAIEKYFEYGEESLITVTEVSENPVFFRQISQDMSLKKILKDSSDVRSQDFDKYYRIVGNIYINNYHTLTSDAVLNENKYPYIIDRAYCLDIDTYFDLEEARARVERDKLCQ